MYLTDRIELIGGRIVAAGSAEGAFRLLKTLLESWTAHAALAFVADDFGQWINALADHFQISHEEIEALVETDPLVPLPIRVNAEELLPDQIPETHRLLRNLLLSANQSNLRFAAGPGFALRIGEDAPTPDFIVAQNHPDLRFTSRHLEGIPEIVVETAAPAKDLFQLQKLYASHGIPEVWVFDLVKREFVVLENRGGYYRPTSCLTGGVYHSAAIRGLVVNVNLLWDVELSAEQMLGAVLLDESDDNYNSIINYSRIPDQRPKNDKSVSARPGQLPFSPRIRYDASPVSFEEFISWTPGCRFEIGAGRVLMPTREGSRNMIGTLLQNIGLRKSVSALPLNDWVTAIAERRLQIASANQIKKYLAREAKLAAKFLRSEFGLRDLRTFGWFDSPPGMWTNLKIIDMTGEQGGPPHSEIRQSLRDRYDDGIEFVGIDALDPGDKQIFEERSLTL